MEVSIEAPKINVEIESPDKIININVQRIPGGGSGGVKQIYWGDTEPTDDNILMWIDTSDGGTSNTQLITFDNQKFITNDNKDFILQEIIGQLLLTRDNMEFVTRDSNRFILKED